MNNTNNINIDDDDNNIDDLDSSWLQEFKNLDNEYKNYYTEELDFINIHLIYVNKDNEIKKIKEEKYMFKTPGILQREELLSIIKHNSFSNQIKYSLLSILKYNITLEPIHLNTFLKNKSNDIGSSYLQSIKNIDTIKFDKSISMFHDINDLIFIFHEKISKNRSHNNNNNNYTKKIFINSNKKMTRRNEIK